MKRAFSFFDKSREVHAKETEIGLDSRTTTAREDTFPTPGRGKRSWKPLMYMSIFWVLAVVFFICHVVFFQYLDNKPVSRTLGQGLQSAVANFFPLFVDVCIVGCLSVAYDQILWNLLRKSAFPTVVIDQLVHLHGSPWELVHPRILRQLLRIKRIVILTLLCAGIPFALVFPPGAVTTDNKIQLRESLNDVPITNITDFGNGSVSQLFDHSLFNMAAALNYELDSIRTDLKAVASQVLSSGKVVDLTSPCGSACAYNVSFDGPTFRCAESDDTAFDSCASQRTSVLANKIYESKDMAEFQTTFDTGLSYYSIGNNDLLVSWYPEPSYDCDLNATRSLSCRMELGTYHLELEFTDGVTSINTTVDNNRDVWTDDHPIMAQFYTAFYPQAGATFPEGLDPNTEFGKAQALAIRQALTMALGGFATLFPDSNPDAEYLYEGNASQIMSSPYVDYVWDGKPHLDITPSGLETLLQDVVVSTLSLNLSTNNRATQVLLGTDVYLFNEKVQFYAPYGSSLVVAFFICIYGAFCWWKNGAPAGSSMLQWLTTTAASKELNDLASKCPGGDGSTSEELELLEVKFVKGSFVTSANTAE